MATQRTDWIEEYVARFAGFPLTFDTILLRPQRRDGRIDKEVCDLLFALRREGLAIALKSQRDPRLRGDAALADWCAGAARDAARQLRGAVRTFAESTVWCEHLRRGRVEMAAGTIRIRHGLAVLETNGEVMLPPDLPERTASGVPFTYLSTNDFLNLVHELRAFPDLLAYLDARLALPMPLRTRIGHERFLHQYYLLSDEQFGRCEGMEDVQAVVGARAREWDERLRWKKSLDRYASLVEYVSDTFATRLPNWQDGPDAETLALMAPEGQRDRLRLQEELCDLPLAARRRIGRAFMVVSDVMAVSPPEIDMRLIAVPDAKPDFLYVLSSTRGVARQEVMRRTREALGAGLAHYRCRRGISITDRDGQNYEIAYGEIDDALAADPRVIEAGRLIFGQSRPRPFDVDTLPRDAADLCGEADYLIRRGRERRTK